MHKKYKTLLLQIVLFLITLLTTSDSGASLIGIKTDSLKDHLITGLWFSLPFLGILTVHEFGHYFAAKWHKVKVTLPYYIPFLGLIGTMGAFIRIKSTPKSRKQFFDIGIAGPLAGFVAALIVLVYGFTHLPPQEYIFEIHEEYQKYGLNYADSVYTRDVVNENQVLMAVGDNLLFDLMGEMFVEDKSLLPNRFEMMHYPFLFAGYLALFFTALNLLPIGQLDGGHVLYGLMGIKLHKIISDIFYVILVTVGGVALFKSPVWGDFFPLASFDNFIVFVPIYLILLYLGFFARITQTLATNILITVVVFVIQYTIAELFLDFQGFLGYLIFAFIIGRFIGTAHPSTNVEEPLSTGRKILGWFAFLIFILCFSFQPIYIVS